MTNTLILQLLHGRDTADEEMNGWGFNGPAIPVECCGFTYDTLWFVPCRRGSHGFAESGRSHSLGWQALRRLSDIQRGLMATQQSGRPLGRPLFCLRSPRPVLFSGSARGGHL